MSTRPSPTTPTSEDGYAETIESVTLPDEVIEFVEAYEAVGGGRDRFVWKWIYRLLPEFTLSSVPRRHREAVRTTKTQFTVFITLLDDLAERDGDAPTFEHLYRSVHWPDAEALLPPEADADVVAFGERLWAAVERSLADAPRHDEFRDVFQYDLRQAFNAMDYSRMLNGRLSMANVAGAKAYDSHNMVMFPYADIDIMYSPSFDPADLGVLRELTWDLQQMARIGNWLTTWEREICEGDFTAGVVVYALQHGLVTLEELEDSGTAVVDRIKTARIETHFLAQWQQLRRKVANRGLEAESVDLEAFAEGMETVMDHHVASEGHK